MYLANSSFPIEEIKIGKPNKFNDSECIAVHSIRVYFVLAVSVGRSRGCALGWNGAPGTRFITKADSYGANLLLPAANPMMAERGFVV